MDCHIDRERERERDREREGERKREWGEGESGGDRGMKREMRVRGEREGGKVS